MARLPWQHTRSRTKSGEKSHISVPQEWFSRNTGEPSRQALQDLVKAHKRETSEDGVSSRSRSRTNTITSTEWHYERSSAGSVLDDAGSRPESAHHTREGSVYSTLEKPEGATKALLAKGGLILRRTGSKMSLSSAGSNSALGFSSPQRNTPQSTTASREDIRNNISAPFNFQHVTHTEQNQFALTRIEEADLAQQFNSFVTRQSAASGLKGIAADDLNADDSQKRPDASITAKGVDAPLPQLPSTDSLPAPTPPPKDEPTPIAVPNNTVLDRSPGNDPLPSDTGVSSQTSILKTPACNQGPKSDFSNGQHHEDTTGSEVDNKPLPQLPVIHAVTTEDNTARAMIAVPLPTPPGVGSEKESPSPRNLHTRQKSSVALPRHYSFRPSNKTSMPNLLSVDHVSTSAKVLARHHSDLALSQQARNTPNDHVDRMSMSFAAIDTVDWEDAVDAAWEDAASDSFDMGNTHTTDVGNGKSSSPNVLESFSSEDSRSGLSTPLMMNAPTQPLPPIPTEKGPTATSGDVHKLKSVKEDEQQADLTGLGITSLPSNNVTSTNHLSRSSSVHHPNRRSSLFIRSGEALTRSSSQESIILSIASSIIGTQRSSNSSLMPDDFLSTNKIEEEPTEEYDAEFQHKNPRPESGCLPADIFERMTKAGNAIASATPVVEEEEMPAVPPVPQHKYSKSASKVAVPERRSSVAASEFGRANRKRSNTMGARPRQSARISYSLFPGTSPGPCPPVVHS